MNRRETILAVCSQEAKKEIERLKEQVKEQVKEQYEVVSKCSVEFNFNALKAVSIKRIIKNNYEYTSVTFITKNNSLDHSFVNCSREIHEQLVQDFRKYKMKEATTFIKNYEIQRKI